jgi:hypothetical protein
VARVARFAVVAAPSSFPFAELRASVVR